MGRRWYVVQTQPSGEAKAVANLNRQGFLTYLPRYLRQRRHARRTDTVMRPLFPRYLFVALDLTLDRWHAIHSTRGVSHLVFAGETPAPVPEGVIEEIRSREDEKGLVIPGLPPGVGPGSRVRLMDGLFADISGIFDHADEGRRVSVLLEMLGREVRVKVPVESITVG